MKQKSVLILEDDMDLAESLLQEFSDHSYSAVHYSQFSKLPADLNFDFAVVDMRLAAGEFGLEAIDWILHRSPHTRILVLTGYGSISTAVEAVKRGAIHYLTKPAPFSRIEAALRGELEFKNESSELPSLSQVEHEYIDFVLTKNRGNISQTAKDLGLHRQSLQRKLKKYT